MRIAIMLALSACSSPPTQPAAYAPPAQRDLQATLNGNRVTFASALTRSRPDGRVELAVSTRGLTCTSIDDQPAPDEVRFELVLVHKLFPDGTFGWRVEKQEFEGVSAGKSNGDAIDASIDTRPGARSRIDVAASGTRKMVSFEGSRTLNIWGRLDAVGCGENKRFAWKPTSAQPAFMDVEGTSFPIAGAAFAEGLSYAPRTGYRLMLGTEAVDCGTPSEFVTLTSSGDVSLEIAFDPEKSAQAELAGDLIGAAGGTYRSEATGLRLQGLPPTSDATSVEVKLGGKAVIAPRNGGDGFTVALRGKVRATVCPKPLPSE